MDNAGITLIRLENMNKLMQKSNSFEHKIPAHCLLEIVRKKPSGRGSKGE